MKITQPIPSSLSLLILFLCLSISKNVAICTEFQAEALLKWKFTLIKPDYCLSSWSPTNASNLCSWFGIRCDSNSTVVGINLPGCYLDGTLEGLDFSALPNLTQINLKNNRFLTGGIYPTFSFLSKLTYLDLSGNNLGGELNDLQHCTEIEYLDLSENQFNGNISLSLSSLRKLKVFSINSNDFYGEVPTNLFKSWTQLTHLDLGKNQFDGFQLPVEICFLRNLISLNLNMALYSFSIPSCFFQNLTQLAYLDLRNDNAYGIEGSLSEKIGLLSKLSHLDLSWNNLNGTIPSEIGNLTNLVFLDLSLNTFTGHIPSTVGRLKKLKVLSLNDNYLRGTLPASLSLLSDLTAIDVSFNMLNGVIDARFGHNSQLITVRLTENNFSGKLPQSLCNSFALQNLRVAKNNFSGQLPSCLMTCSNLTHIDVHGNKLFGRLNEAFGSHPHLLLVDLSRNSFTGTLSSLISSKKLIKLHLSENKISGEIPVEFGNMTNLEELELGFNYLWGKIPAELGNLPLQNLNISSNPILDVVPSFVGKLPLCSLDLSSLHLAGDIQTMYSDQNATKNLICGIKTMFMQHNNLSGHIPSFLCHLAFNLLDLSYNQLNGSAPACLFESSELYLLQLESNNLSGATNSDGSPFVQMQSLHLARNTLTGEFPLCFKNYTQLVLLDLGENNFHGRIPSWIGVAFPELQVLRLRSNMFSGEIPLELALLYNLQVLDLADNNLIGRLRQNFNNFWIMKSKSEEAYNYTSYRGRYMDSIVIQWKGEPVFVFNKILSLMKGIDLSANSLSHEIPLELANLSGILFLNLSWNCFTGLIPENIGNLESAQYLDLSNNKLSGRIPDGIVKLNFLGMLNLSHNNLSGKIPTGTQLQSFSASSYTGNNGLCGPPLPTKCPEDAPSTPVSSKNHDEYNGGSRNNTDNIWFSTFVCLGFIFGFWLFFGLLFFIRSLKLIYFHNVDYMLLKLFGSYR